MFITKLFQVTVLACVYSLPMVSCQDVASDLVRRTENSAGDSNSAIKRYSMLYNRCSQKHLQIVGKNVTATGKHNSAFANVSLETLVLKNTVGLRILGLSSARYICFNKRGKLIARFGGQNRRCMFNEVISEDMYTRFQSLYNHDWFVGFNKKGKPLKGGDYNHKGKRRKCFSFIKRGYPYVNLNPHQPGPKLPADPSSIHTFLREEPEKQKRNRKGKRPSR